MKGGLGVCLVAAALLACVSFVVLSQHGLSFSSLKQKDGPHHRHPGIKAHAHSNSDDNNNGHAHGKKQSHPHQNNAVAGRHVASDDDGDVHAGSKPATARGDDATQQLEKLDVDVCPNSTVHFDTHAPVMSEKFAEHINFMARKIGKVTTNRVYSLPKDVALGEQCGSVTPECAFWSCYPVSASKMTLKKCCHEHKALRDTAWWVIDMFESNGIRYFLSTGTALGAIRHHGVIIPWDTDVDIAFFPEDAPKVKALFLAHTHEHHFEADPQGKQMYWVHASKNGRPAGGPHVELFFEADYTKHLEALLPLERCSLYGKAAWCPGRGMFGIWFKSGWKSYGGAHYHDDGRCTVYEMGKRIEKRDC